MVDRWYVAKAKWAQEEAACDRLSRQGFDAYSPSVHIEKLRKGRITTLPEPLFPSYLLVRFSLEACQWRDINNTRGVIKLLAFGEEGIPMPLPVGEVERLQARENAGELFISEIVRLRRGDMVRLTSGPAVNQIGKVIRTRGERVELLLTMLGSSIRCVAPIHQVALVGYGDRSTSDAEAMPR